LIRALQMPRVSVVLIAYNGQRTIAKAIDSVLAQTVTDLELVVVDDGSTDGTAAVVAGYRDPRLTYHRQPNAGPSAARNTGIRATSAPWVAFLDCDDWWTPGKLARQLDATPGVGLVYSGAVFFDPSGRQIEVMHPTLRGHVLPALLLGNGITGGGSTAMVRRDVLEAVGGFRDDLHYGEEWELWLRVAAREPIAFVPEIDVCLTSLPDSQGKQCVKMHASCLGIVDEAFRTYAAHLAHLRPRAITAVDYRACLDYEAYGTKWAAWRLAARVARRQPFHIGALLRLWRIPVRALAHVVTSGV
jgi:glycosyltransferase involved in cell wall biosynthesis